MAALVGVFFYSKKIKTIQKELDRYRERLAESRGTIQGLREELEVLNKYEELAWRRLCTGPNNKPDWRDSLNGGDARRVMKAVSDAYFRQIICDGDKGLYESDLAQTKESKSIP
ncbi:hypothetical protein PGO05_03640 [Klebsiella aerogenes]